MKKKEIQDDTPVKLINPTRQHLTVERLKELSGLTDIKDEEAAEAVASIRLLAKLLCRRWAKKNSHTIDNQLVVNLNSQKRAA
jgi:hypothetical protein